eukprot:CAMPEP_0118980666 /NCGR_PEP_ID=MMETSP1173-20130426/28839_1 /TAXON_ID=1034831 /ORGANISM="Rhizochromulina marina cf, Strain CCMP1243" /LENGTH=137 /DNA_ID=CAMNT_0006931025 /DNA_START=71 /DNA_END=484 /DNA_ORIENTATION=+
MALYNLARALNFNKKPEEALAILQTAENLRGEHGDILFQKALALRGLGDLEGAQAQYEAALALDPGFEDALNNLGNLVFTRGDPARAISLWGRLLDLNPGRATSFLPIVDRKAPFAARVTEEFRLRVLRLSGTKTGV